MSSGKGGGGTNSADLERDRLAREERESNRAREEARSARELAQRQALFNTNLTTAEQGARQRFQGSLRNRGITDDNDIGTIIERALGSARQSVPSDTTSLGGFDVNVAPYFSDAVLEDAYGDVRDERRQNYGTQVANAFSTGAENDLLPDTLDDPFVDAFLGSQRTDAQLMLDRARARGNLDQTGYDRGIQRLDELGRAGSSEAQQITNALISAGRGDLRNIANRASTDAGAYEIGRQFSIDPYQEEWDTFRNNFTSGLEGRVRSALEGQQFFDIGDIITQAGIRQGAQNPTQAQADAVAARRNVRDAERGLGGAGQF
jgi:hypothetical protein